MKLNKGTGQGAGAAGAGEIRRTYDLNALDQPTVGKLRGCIGHIRESACELEALRRCPTGEINLDEVVAKGLLLEGQLAELKRLARLCART